MENWFYFHCSSPESSGHMHVFWHNCIPVHLSSEGKMSIYTTPPSEIQLKKKSVHQVCPQAWALLHVHYLSMIASHKVFKRTCLCLKGRQKRQVSLGTSVCFKCVNPNLADWNLLASFWMIMVLIVFFSEPVSSLWFTPKLKSQNFLDFAVSQPPLIKQLVWLCYMLKVDKRRVF